MLHECLSYGLGHAADSSGACRGLQVPLTSGDLSARGPNLVCGHDVALDVRVVPTST